MDSSLTKETQLDALMPVIREQLANGNSVRLFPKGTSMLPMLRQGIDSVILSPISDKLKKHDLPLYQRANGQYVLHRIVKAGETYSCIGDNQFLYEHGIKHNQMIALVTGFYRGDKKISTDSFAYKLYCLFWYYSRPFRHFCNRGIGWIRRHIT